LSACEKKCILKTERSRKDFGLFRYMFLQILKSQLSKLMRDLESFPSLGQEESVPVNESKYLSKSESFYFWFAGFFKIVLLISPSRYLDNRFNCL